MEYKLIPEPKWSVRICARQMLTSAAVLVFHRIEEFLVGLGLLDAVD